MVFICLFQETVLAKISMAQSRFYPVEINLILSHAGKHNPFLLYIHSGNYTKMVKTIKAKLLSLQINDYICVYICLSIQI